MLILGYYGQTITLVVNMDVTCLVYEPTKALGLMYISVIKTSAVIIIIMQKFKEQVSIWHFIEEILWVQIGFTVGVLITVAAMDLFIKEK